jgi:cyanophycin synthetase
MKIRQLKVMRGPNIWSDDYHKLIVLKLDVRSEHNEDPDIKGLLARFEEEAAGKRHSKAEEAGKKVFNLPELVGHIACRLQELAWMDCTYYNVHPTRDSSIYHVVFSYIFVEAGEFAADAAVRIVEALLDDDPGYEIYEDVLDLRALHNSSHMGLSTTAVAEAAEKRGIPFTKLKEYSMLGYGAKQKRIQATIASTTAYIGIDLTGDKDGTKSLLKEFSVPVPEGITISKEDNLSYALQVVGYPVVIKPLDGNHGRGITVNITNYEDALIAFNIAQKISKVVIVEKYVQGTDYRLLVINYKFIGALKRVPAFVIGDGRSTIKQLIDDINKDPAREDKPGNLLKKIDIDEPTLNLLRRNQLTLDSVLEDGRKLFVKETANVSNAAMPIDVTDEMHPHNILQAERIARIVGLDICGIDLLSPDLSVPFHENGAAVVEVNAAPGIRMHMTPAIGKPRDAAGAIVSMLFPKNEPYSIPIVAVTGTNGKTTTVRLVAHIASTAKMVTGYTTTDGIYLNNMLIERGDCAGPISADYVLKDPTVEFAVLECARGGILREGLAFRHCDVGIITNVTGDHLGLDDVNTMEELARLKSVVVRSVKRDGYAVLNADDDIVFAMTGQLKCNVALFSSEGYTQRVREHCEKGGLACIYEEGDILVCHGKEKTMIEEAHDIPITFDGSAVFNIQNVLAAVLAAYVQEIDLEHIREGLRSFEPSPEHTPGRMNIWRFRDFDMVLDYAHNAPGFQALGQYMEHVSASRKIAVISGPGDRSDDDIVSIGKEVGKIFDEVIVRQDGNLRGRTGNELASLLIEGVKSVNPDLPVKIVPKLEEAIQYAIDHAPKNAMIVVCSEKVEETIDIILEHKAAESPEPRAAKEIPATEQKEKEKKEKKEEKRKRS